MSHFWLSSIATRGHSKSVGQQAKRSNTVHVMEYSYSFSISQSNMLRAFLDNAWNHATPNRRACTGYTQNAPRISVISYNFVLTPISCPFIIMSFVNSGACNASAAACATSKTGLDGLPRGFVTAAHAPVKRAPSSLAR